MQEDRNLWYEETKNYFSKNGQEFLKYQLEIITDEQLLNLFNLKFKEPNVSILLAVFLGYIGADRFYIKSWLLGLIKLLTCGGMSILWIIDIFTIKKKTLKYNDDLVFKALRGLPLNNYESYNSKFKNIQIDNDKMKETAAIGNAVLQGFDELHNINEKSRENDYILPR